MTKRIESTYCTERHEWNLLIRRPFYLNLRGRSFKTVLNWFPTPFNDYSRTFGRVSRATMHNLNCRIANDLDVLRHPEKAALYDATNETP